MSEENFIDFKCPYCERIVSFPDDDVGLVQECPECGETIVVPQPGSEFGNKLAIPVTTARLTLRRLRPEDLEDMLEVQQGDEGSLYGDQRAKNETEMSAWLQSEAQQSLTRPDEAGRYSLWLGIELQTSGKLVGFLSLYFTDVERLQTGVTVDVNPAYQKQGYATEALSGVIGFCFEGIGLHRVIGSCESAHLAARRVMEKAGMKFEGEFRQNIFRDGLPKRSAWLWFRRRCVLAIKILRIEHCIVDRIPPLLQ